MKRSKGFTLLEILIVVSLIGIAYTLLPHMFFSGVSGAELKSNARQVAGGLKLARDAAIYSRKPAFLSLDLAKRSFTVDGEAQVYQLHPEVELKLYTSQDDLVSESVGTIRFYSDGSSNGGRVTVGSGGRAYLIDVDWLTGRVTIEDGDAANKKP
jgi:general secretion pathway protein H